MVIEIFKFEDRTSDGGNFLPIGRDDSLVYLVLYGIGVSFESFSGNYPHES